MTSRLSTILVSLWQSRVFNPRHKERRVSKIEFDQVCLNIPEKGLTPSKLVAESIFCSNIGSANIWIDSAQCNDVGCRNHKQYDGSKFSTYTQLNYDLDVEFGTGELQGKINSDHVYAAGVKVENQNFAEITHEIGPIFAQVSYLCVLY